jgi:hypothetical protein
MNTRRRSSRFALWTALLAYSAFAACGDVTSEPIFRSPIAREACEADAGCDESVPRCDAGTCLECTDPSDCDEDEAFCDASGRCVECLTDAQCEDMDERCSPALGECAEPCSEGDACDSDDPICDVNIGFCVECLTDEHCDDDERCRGWECVE